MFCAHVAEALSCDHAGWLLLLLLLLLLLESLALCQAPGRKVRGLAINQPPTWRCMQVMECAFGGCLTEHVSDRVAAQEAQGGGLAVSEDEARYLFRASAGGAAEGACCAGLPAPL